MANDDEVAIKVSNVSKSFKLPHEKNTSVKSFVISPFKKRTYEKQQVLKDVSFEIKKGEFFGIVGRNGSGKSTLLKLLAGIYSPNEGLIQINGMLTPFIELGVGFNPNLTGRENVFLNGALLGFNRKEMAAMYESIVEFAELEAHMDKMLKNYSTGMQVRLAFSIAVKAKSDILIFDEVLAVGDEAFQKKCMRVFEDYRRSKQTVILVTHSMEIVRKLCTRALMLSSGKIEVIGTVNKVASAYSQSNVEPDVKEPVEVLAKESPKELILTGCEATYKPGDEMKLKIKWPKLGGVRKVGVAIIRDNGDYVFGSNTGDIAVSGKHIDYAVNLDIGQGSYYLTVAIYDEKGESLVSYDKVKNFLIYDDYRTDTGGQVRLKYRYSQ